MENFNMMCFKDTTTNDM